MHPNHIETGINSEIQQLTEKLYKPIIRKLQKKQQKLYFSFKDNIWNADQPDMKVSKCNEGIHFF